MKLTHFKDKSVVIFFALYLHREINTELTTKHVFPSITHRNVISRPYLYDFIGAPYIVIIRIKVY